MRDPADDFNESELRWVKAFCIRYDIERFVIDQFIEALEAAASEAE